jgi:DNA replication protein DnaC
MNTSVAEQVWVGVDVGKARRRTRRIHEAKFPRIKRLEDLDLRQLPGLPPPLRAARAAGTWIDRGEPVVLLGDSGTGKTHLLIGLGVAAADAGRRVRYVTTAAPVNELVEAGSAPIWPSSTQTPIWCATWLCCPGTAKISSLTGCG